MRFQKRLISAFVTFALVCGMFPQLAFASVVEGSNLDSEGTENSQVVQDEVRPSSGNTSNIEDESDDVEVSTDKSTEEASTEDSNTVVDQNNDESLDSTDDNLSNSTDEDDSLIQSSEEDIQAAIQMLDLRDADVAQIEAVVNAEMTYVTLAAKGGDFDQASSVRFPTWSQSGNQSDIRWYSGFKWNGAWICTVPISNHKQLGTYIVHAYVVVNGSEKQIASTTFEITGPSADVSSEAGSGDNYVVKVSPRANSASIESVKVASWKSSNTDQAGIVWADAQKDTDGVWAATIPTTGTNRGSGSYVNHVYVDCLNGVSSRYVGATSHSFTGETTATIKASLNADETIATITAYGGNFAKASSVTFPTWAKPSQADIRWYNASNNNGVWTCRINVSSHACVGTFNVHAYGVINGKQQYVGSTGFTVHKPEATLTLTQNKANDPCAPVVATLKLTSDANLASYVSIPAWTKQNGQDDIVWYAASSGSDSAVWTAEIPTTGAGRGSGEYICHAYVTLKNSTQVYVAQSSITVEVPKDASLEANINSAQTQVNIVAKGGSFVGASSVCFAVWSNTRGQDDLIWYQAKRNATSWTYAVPISNHKTAGVYHIHAYAVVNGRDDLRATKDFSVTSPKANGALSISQTSNQVELDEATVSMTLASSSPSVKAVQFPTWSTKNGQDDIVWYNASSSDGLTWTARISTSGIGRGTGEYIVHAYATCENGVTSLVSTGSKSLKASSSPVVRASLNADQTTATITASGGEFSLASSVTFPVWADAKQRDIVWYSAHREDGTWKATVDISRHKIAGTYNVHAYAVVGGVQVFTGAASFSVISPAGSVSVSQSADQIIRDEATVSFTLGNTSSQASKISYVQFPVWSATKGQDDIAWYRASKPDSTNGNTWTLTIPTSGVGRGSDTYIAHCYVTCANGVTAFAGGTTANLKASNMPTFSASLNADHTKITIKASGGKFSTASSVQFPVWSSKNGQDDIVWYSAGKSGGMWVKDVPISNHRTAGVYCVHAYATNNGVMSYAAGTSTDPVSAPTSAKVSATQNGNGVISVSISNIQSISGVYSIQVPTWTSQGGQDDIVWHNASKLSDGSWVAKIPASDHYGREDSYISHVYVTGGNHVMGMVGSTHIFLPLKNYSYVAGAYGSGKRTVWVKNPTSSDVQVPTWSEAGGQDDISWIRASHVGDNLYKAEIDCTSMKHSGNAISHIYIGGKLTSVLRFNIAESEILPAHIRSMHNRILGLSSRTSWLIAVDTDACTVGIFRGSQGSWSLDRSYVCSVGAWSSPTKKGDFTVGTKGYVFGHGYSCYYYTQFSGNYLFHSVKYYQNTFNLMDGRLGEHISAGCVRLHIDNAKWIYDNIPSGTRVIVY